MPEYYFDIETYSPQSKPDFEKDKIITIQFQKIDLRTGEERGGLEILKEWEKDEKTILEKFYNDFFKDKGVYCFIPVGHNLDFDLEFLRCRLKNIGIELPVKQLYCDKPRFDTKPICILLNGGEFKGCSLNKFTLKSWSGKQIKEWYEKKRLRINRKVY